MPFAFRSDFLPILCGVLSLLSVSVHVVVFWRSLRSNIVLRLSIETILCFWFRNVEVVVRKSGDQKEDERPLIKATKNCAMSASWTT